MDCTYSYPKNSLSSIPLLPFMAFDLQFKENLAIAFQDDSDWAMTEVGLILSEEGEEIWFILDSKMNGEQFAIVDKELYAKNKEKLDYFPAQIISGDVKVMRRIASNLRHYEVRYTRLDGEIVHFKASAKINKKPPFFSNGHTMNHSDQRAIVSLFIDHLSFLTEVTFLSKPKKIHRIFGKKIQVLMGQTVIGIKTADWKQFYHDKNYFPYTLISKEKTFFQELIAIKLQFGQINFLKPLPDLSCFEGEEIISFEIENLQQNILQRGALKIKADNQKIEIFISPRWPSFAKYRQIKVEGIKHSDYIEFSAKRIKR